MLNEKDSKRFWAKVDKTNSCWNWTAAKGAKGYGRFKLNGKLVSPHAISYQIHNDDYDSTKDVCHKCDNPSCINPEHLFLGTRTQNVLDSIQKGRWNGNPTKGADHPSSKLTDKDVMLIKAILKYSDLNVVQIAKMFSVSLTTIKNIRSKKRWSHINLPQ